MRVLSLLLTVTAIADVYVLGAEAQFRCDYSYDSKSNRYYKYHEIPAAWDEAQLRCYLEGAILASPIDRKVLKALSDLITSNRGREILIGAAAKHSIGDFLTIEGIPVKQLLSTWDPAEPLIRKDDDNTLSLSKQGHLTVQPANARFPYICYKHDSTVQPFRSDCGTTDSQYVLYPTGSCYKFHRQPRIWSSAHMACRAEGGYLTIINSDDEKAVIWKIFYDNPAIKMVGNFDKDLAHIGFKDWDEHGTWRTIHGESLEQAGFSQWSPGEPSNSTTYELENCGESLEQAGFQQWSPGEPNNSTLNGPEFCGTVKRDALLNDYACAKVAPFICEKDPQELVKNGCL